MSDTSLGPAVTVEGASCRLRPSPTALAVRLDGLRARDGAALTALLERLPEPPWDVDVPSADPLVGLVREAGFDVYATGALWARPVEGIPVPDPPGRVEISDYRNDMAAHFVAAERRAMEGLAAFTELGSPSGYEWGEGQGVFVVAYRNGELVGFAHADMPDGTLDWMGVVPDARRQGIGTALLRGLAQRVREQRGTHLMAFAQEGTDGPAFLASQGFAAKGGRTLAIRRADGASGGGHGEPAPQGPVRSIR